MAAIARTLFDSCQHCAALRIWMGVPASLCKSSIGVDKALEHRYDQPDWLGCRLTALTAEDISISFEIAMQRRWKLQRHLDGPVVGDRPQLQLGHCVAP